MTDGSFKEKVFSLVKEEYTFLDSFVSYSQTPKLLCRHNTCGYEWQVNTKHFIHSGTRCPVCTKKKVRSTRQKSPQEFITEVLELVGDEYQFLEDYRGTDTKIRCRHTVCGHEYSVTPYKFVHARRRCPVCALATRSLKMRTPVDQFRAKFYELFEGYELMTPYVNQNTLVEIKHNECGGRFTRTPKLLLRNKTLCCDFCKIQSFGESVINQYLGQVKANYKREFRFADCRNKYPLPFDFAILNSVDQVVGVIEYDGRQHYEDTGGYFGGRARLAERLRLDGIKNTYCVVNQIPLLRITYGHTQNEIQEYVKDFLERIERAVKKR